MTVEKDGEEPLSQDEISQVISAHRGRRGVTAPTTPQPGLVETATRFAARSPMVQDIAGAAQEKALDVARGAGGVIRNYVAPAVNRFNAMNDAPIKAVVGVTGDMVRNAAQGFGAAYNRFVAPSVSEAKDIFQNYVMPPPEPQMPSRTNAPIVATRIQPPAQIPVVKTKDQFNALPSGSVYTGQDGKLYRKP